MRLYTVLLDEEEHVAVLGLNKKLYLLSELGYKYEDMNTLISEITDNEMERINVIKNDTTLLEQKTGYSLKDTKLLSPIPKPKQDIVCIGVNYDEHVEEAKHIIDFENKHATVYFSKRVNRASGNNDVIPVYSFVDSLDYEVELGVIIRKDVFNAKEEAALNAVFGYTVINDVSARNIQLKHQQWYLGKSLDGYTPIGPCIVTKDEIKDIHNLNITCKVNGEIRQNSNTKYMITTIVKAIAELSEGMTLQSGTIIATGTPGGVAMGMKPPKFLHSGDEVVCEIDEIGVLSNQVG